MLWSSASIEVRQAAAQCVKNVLATTSGVDFWEQHRDNRDPMLAYLNPFRKAKKMVGEGVFVCVPALIIGSYLQHVCVPINTKDQLFFATVLPHLSKMCIFIYTHILSASAWLLPIVVSD